MITPSSNTQSNAQGSFGAVLQQARKNKQVTLEAAAAELFILKRHLEALESENFAELPQAAFARGFAINYAKYLGLDSAKIASSFDAAYPNELKAKSASNIDTPLRPMGTLQRDTHNRIRFNPLLIIGVIGLIILAVFLFRMVSNASKENTQEPVSAVEDMSVIEQAQGAAINSDASGVGASGSALNLGDAATTATLNLVLTSDAVVSITDASGNSLINGSQSAGNYDLSGMPPFNVQIDNIDNVSLMLNQQAVALDTYATDKQATFELAP
ncbi:helix-turn-helix domain-containing protein [Psychrobacter sp. Ps2]|uniref:helix-turn-helix domain-containing protein n=1 Tax=Psychrobacter sp. Ps2 TaxID=2790956 RepID=UPI001EE00EEC|nr:helix-turn-helix domain-containing protein [Psychrobacter sp. Ps2]MCG3859925.1 helix-turn-helix domain-containing protein [Psychrobacter sp. Ps2]